MKTKRLYKVLDEVESGTVLEDERGIQQPVERWLEIMEGHNDMAEYAIRDGDEIFFCSKDGDILSPTDPVFTIVETD